jgi:hypothetical protein
LPDLRHKWFVGIRTADKRGRWDNSDSDPLKRRGPVSRSGDASGIGKVQAPGEVGVDRKGKAARRGGGWSRKVRLPGEVGVVREGGAGADGSEAQGGS